MAPELACGDFHRLSVYKLDRTWRRLPAREKRDSKAEFAAVVNELSQGCPITAYSLVGTRADADLLLAQAAADIVTFHEVASRLNSTHLAGYLDQTYSYLAVRRRTQYRHGGGGPGDVKEDGHRYLIVYPMVKKREWYRLPQEERQEMMNDHFRVGHKYPSVKINTTYSFGLDDQEFVVSFELDEPRDFVSLVMELREVPAGFYTETETPIFTALRMPVEEALESLGT